LQRSALTELTKQSNDGSVSIEEFKKFAKTHQTMLARAFEVQDKLKIATLGQGKWEDVSTRKVLVHTGFTVPLCELMILVSAPAPAEMCAAYCCRCVCG
jgi:hypothetical protein